MLKIAVTDDPAYNLTELQSALEKSGREWELFSSSSVGDLPQLVSRNECDVVVLRTTQLVGDGATVFEKLRDEHPGLVRIVVALDMADEFSARGEFAAHQYFHGPIRSDKFMRAVVEATRLRDGLRSKPVLRLVSQIKRLPALPKNYRELNDILNREDVTLTDIAHIIKKDVAMVAKVLQVANSALFSNRKRVVRSVESGVKMLGVVNIKLLVLAVEVFTEFQGEKADTKAHEELWEHSMRVGKYAAYIAKQLSADPKVEKDALTAGILHDVGKIVLRNHFSKEWTKMEELRASKKALSQVAAERAVFGATHAEIGGYLLGRWGLPDSVVEAVAYHHQALKVGVYGKETLAAVVIGNSIEHLLSGDPKDDSIAPLLEQLRAVQQYPNWCRACIEL